LARAIGSFIAEVQIDTSEEPPPPPVAISTAVKLDSNSAQLLVGSEPSILDMGQLDAPDAEPPTTQLPLPAQQTVAESEAQNSNRRKFQLALLAVVAVALGLTLGYFLVGRGARRVPEKVQWIAVLPLLNLSQDSEQDYLVDGMTDQLITDLARASPLRVISRTSTMQYKGTQSVAGDRGRIERRRYRRRLGSTFPKQCADHRPIVGCT